MTQPHTNSDSEIGEILIKELNALKHQWQLEILEGIPDDTIVHGHQQPLTVAFLKRNLTNPDTKEAKE